MSASETAETFRSRCPYRLHKDVSDERATNRNCLRADAIGQFGIMPRCSLKTPSHWPPQATALRWIGSGGTVTVFGACSANCPLGHKWCSRCGHTLDAHSLVSGVDHCWVESCGCDGFIEGSQIAGKLHKALEVCK